ncbi:MAG: tetratricopeptide repeat protein [Limnohabitans sp.]|nr:tetratricopeptide repeat protein [Limnohabitans sp.]
MKSFHCFITFTTLLFIPLITFSQKNTSLNETPEAKKVRQDAIVKEFLTDCAEKYNYTFAMDKWQNCLDQGLKRDSTIAYLWQQKAMPYFKARKYEVGMQYIDRAVFYDAKRWQSYRAFIKCIFAKTYKEALIDFEDCKKKFGNDYVMDHSYNFYIGLCYLQLDEIPTAQEYFKEYIDELYQKRNGLEHHTAYFYYGITLFEQNKWEEAIAIFDKALKIYSNFSEAKLYKSICLARLEKNEESSKLFKEAKEDALKGYNINEDNAVYEMYPYQKKWKL